MILYFPIQKLVWVFSRRFSTTFVNYTNFVSVDLLVKNEWTVREALPWVFKPFSFSIWYSTIFTPLVIYSIVHCGLFNKFNCNRDSRTFSSHALCVVAPHTSDISSMDPLTVRPFISLDMISLKACKRTIRSTEVYLTRHLQTITHLLSTQSYSRFHFCTNLYLNRQNWPIFFHQLKIFMSYHFMISPFGIRVSTGDGLQAVLSDKLFDTERRYTVLVRSHPDQLWFHPGMLSESQWGKWVKMNHSFLFHQIGGETISLISLIV